MRHYCTLFDHRYLPQGLALYESLKRHSSEPFQLHILAMDDECFDSIPDLKAFVTSLSYFEKYTGIDEVRKTRTFQEYCWTCASAFTYRLASLGITEITYLDADCFFFSDPEAVFAEIGDKSIGIVPHRFPPERKHMEVNGKFNVSWVTFRGPVGFKCLEKWARQCREKCSAKEGCGDQKYLDSWPSDYPGEVCEIQNIGVGAAPWNLKQYKVTSWCDIPQLQATGDGMQIRLDGVPLCLFHFHEFVPGKRLTNYKLRKEDIEFIYKPYIAAVDKAKQQVDSLMMEAIQ